MGLLAWVTVTKDSNQKQTPAIVPMTGASEGINDKHDNNLPRSPQKYNDGVEEPLAQTTAPPSPNYPPPILRAMTTAFNHPAWNRNPPSMRIVVTELVSRLDLDNPEEPVYFCRRKVAEKCALTRQTVAKRLAELEADGHLMRLDQDVTRRGYFSYSRLQVTPAFLALIGLVAPCKKIIPPISGKEEEQSKRDTPGPGGFQSSVPPKNTPSSPPRPHQDPAIQELFNLGLSDIQVFSLMDKASCAGHRLSTVVEAVMPYISALKGLPRRIIAYLRRCFASGQDFQATLVRQRKKADQKAEWEAKEKAAAEAKAARKAAREADERENQVQKQAEEKRRSDGHEADQAKVPIWAEARMSLAKSIGQSNWELTRWLSGQWTGPGRLELSAPNSVIINFCRQFFEEIKTALTEAGGVAETEIVFIAQSQET